MTASGDAGNLRLIAFPGAPNLPIFAAIARGDFEREGLALDFQTTPSSRFQIENLVAGRFDIAATAYDNVVAYQEGQGAVALDTEPDLGVLMGATRIELSLVVAPDIRSFDDLRGRTLALDALATGFAFVLYRMLERAGLALDDCELRTVGATPQRWEAVREGAAAGTLMIEPFTSVAVARGFRVLTTSRDVLAHYQGGIFTASRAWAADHTHAVEAFIRAYLAGLAWTLNPTHRLGAEKLLLERMPAIKPAVAPAVMTKLLDPATGLTPGAAIDRAGMQTVLELRSRYAPAGRAPRAIEDYLDLGYFERSSGR